MKKNYIPSILLIVILIIFLYGLISSKPTLGHQASFTVYHPYPPGVSYQGKLYRDLGYATTRGASDLEGYAEACSIKHFAGNLKPLDLDIDGSTNDERYVGGIIYINPKNPGTIIVKYQKELYGILTDCYVELTEK